MTKSKNPNPLTLGQIEAIKLRATWLGNVTVAVFVGGAAGFAFRIPFENPAWQTALFAFGFLVSGVIVAAVMHHWACKILDQLDTNTPLYGPVVTRDEAVQIAIAAIQAAESQRPVR